MRNHAMKNGAALRLGHAHLYKKSNLVVDLVTLATCVTTAKGALQDIDRMLESDMQSANSR